MKVKALFFAILFLCASSLFPYESVKKLNLPAQGIEELEIDCAAGFLKVYGIEGLAKIEVTAEIIVKGKRVRDEEEFIRENIKLSLEKRGARAVLISKFRESFPYISFRTKVINLTVNVPKNINLQIDDSSGSMSVEDIIGQLDIDDSSGEIYVEDIKGNVDINDSSGDIEAIAISGYLSIDDGSGGIDVKDVVGDVSIDDGSGSIYVNNVGGSLTVSDGSGSINVDGVDKDVIIRDDGSGGVKIRNVKGKIRK
ncbi:MAG: DUF4097 family beta strand repeat protein [Candidatus Aminicenantes bacterium]|nr:MAG: DUF4097 family beta strand repeat protein [Candidatus Aminicenantes bacterium]